MKRKVLFRLSLYELDTVTIFLSYATAVVLRYHIMDSEPGINALSMPYLLIALIYSLIMANVIQIINGTGKYFYRNDYFENVKLMSAQAIGCLVLLSFFYIANVIYFSRWALVLFWLFSCMFSIIRNGVVRSYLHKKRKAGQNKNHVLVIGDGKYAEEYMNAVFEYPEYGFNIFGYLGEKRNAPPICLNKWNSNDLKEQTTEIPCRGEYYDLKTILKTNDINEVVFALDEKVHVDLEHLFNDAKKQM